MISTPKFSSRPVTPHHPRTLQAAKIGADVMTAPPKVIHDLFKHVLTRQGHRRLPGRLGQDWPEHFVTPANIPAQAGDLVRQGRLATD